MTVKHGIYRHYKGGEYEVIGAARHSETEEELIVYRQLYDSQAFPKGAIWVRPKAMFLETVEVDGKHVPRFAFLKEKL